MKTAILFLILSFTTILYAAPKKILIIYGKSSHQNYCHNNKEVGLMLEKKLAEFKCCEEPFEITSSFLYPKDLSLVENADLIIISSDGGPGHALANPGDETKYMKHLDGILKKNKTGLIVIHWATDAPSNKFATLNVENGKIMTDWIGAVYHWEKNRNSPKSSWTWKFPVLDLAVNQEHPIGKGVPENFKLQDEYYFNFFTKGPDSRNPKNDRVTYIHSANVPDNRDEIEQEELWRIQPAYWAFERENDGRSVAMTSAHMYHTWANPHFFKTFANSVLWGLNLPVPEEGADIVAPTLDELVSMSAKVQIHTKALHFK